MGMILLADRSHPLPYPITLVVVCDGEHAFLPLLRTFPVREPPNAAAATAGWVFGENGRVLCPRCAMLA